MRVRNILFFTLLLLTFTYLTFTLKFTAIPSSKVWYQSKRHPSSLFGLGTRFSLLPVVHGVLAGPPPSSVFTPFALSLPSYLHTYLRYQRKSPLKPSLLLFFLPLSIHPSLLPHQRPNHFRTGTSISSPPLTTTAPTLTEIP